MTTREQHLFFASPVLSGRDTCDVLMESPRRATSYDPELLYVECRICGRPVLWENGKTTELLFTAGIDLGDLDERCMIISEGCPTCAASADEGYALAVVRIAGLTPEEAVHMSRPGGTA